MAIQTVNIGAIVNDGTGDPLRTAYSKLNDNFTDTANAASKLVQTSPTDATADALMAVGAFGLGGHIDLRGTIYETGTPADLIGKGDISGLCDNSSLGIPELAPSDFGSLHVSMQWNSTSSTILGVYYREFKFEGGTFVQFASTSTTWSAWQPVYTGANYQPFSPTGIGCRLLLNNNSGSNLSQGAAVDGALLKDVDFDSGGNLVVNTSVKSGDWIHVGGALCSNLQSSIFVKVAL